MKLTEESKKDGSEEAVTKVKSIMNNSGHKPVYECPTELLKHIGSDEFLMACEVFKFNRYGWQKHRQLAMTSLSLYILKDDYTLLR